MAMDKLLRGGIGERPDPRGQSSSFLQSLPRLHGQPPPVLGGLGRSGAHWRAWLICARPVRRSQRDPALCSGASRTPRLNYRISLSRERWEPGMRRLGAAPLDDPADLMAFGFLQLIWGWRSKAPSGSDSQGQFLLTCAVSCYLAQGERCGSLSSDEL